MYKNLLNNIKSNKQFIVNIYTYLNKKTEQMIIYIQYLLKKLFLQ